ncbi:MAG: class I SAM-dependent RNA methyltransferase [Deltaproteobacteria bacterium]|nr:class I SAM-dependent RNA methyltransferase [Deltaproteobacteria bacterium]
MDVSVKIDSLSFGGSGVGRISGKVVFVPYSAPGDDIKVRITKDTKGFAEGDIVEFISASPLREEPPCTYHSVCGGCHWLHIPYKEQVKVKEDIFKDTLRRIGKIGPSIVLPAKPSPLELNYRSRVQFKVLENKIGFYKRESHDLVEISECPLAHPLINRILKRVREIWPPSPSYISRVDISVSPSDGNGIVSIYLSERSDFDFNSFFRRLAHSIPEVTGLIFHYGREEKISGSSYLYSLEGEFRFRASEGSFSQVNYQQNLKMKDYILSLADLKGDETVLELYSGGGNFTIPVASRAGKVIGIEVSPSSISDALENARINNIKNATFIQATAEKGLKEIQNSKV